ncbi:MAG TPA: c-type cytochrome [Janthinobacterium sp.]|nr:c-type cytochrome [Janthinobacterium sp.]
MLAIVALLALSRHRAIDPITPPARENFDARLIARGAQLAAIGNCASCHTMRQRAPFAGGVPLATPFGTIHGSNITPDVQTGIGRWSQAAFDRAMRSGIARDGSHLYPAFPYDHFTQLSGEDLKALYAFMMTRDPVLAATPENKLNFPFNIRPLIAGWNLLFLRKQSFQPVSTQSVEWNRGAYLAQSLAHCSSCHTPRNRLGGEKRDAAFGGGETEGWYAPPLNAKSPSPIPWDVAHMSEYLRTGIAPDHAIAGGPMQEVVSNLGQADEADVRAIATYIVSLMGPVTAERQKRAAASRERAAQPLSAITPRTEDAQIRQGASIYAMACASCHDGGRGPTSNSALRLPLAVAVYDDDPRSLLRIVREGITPPDGARGRWMPAFQGVLNDEQLTSLAAYLRSEAANAPPWPDLARTVRDTAP